MRIAKNNRQNIIWNNHIISLLFVLWFLFLFKPILALSSAPFVFDPLNPPRDLQPLIIWIFYYVLIISGLILVAVLIKAGFSFLFSTGNPDRMNDAKNQLWSGFFGLLLILSSIVILRILNPELVPEEVIWKPEVERVVLGAVRQSGVSFCYETENVHFQGIDFRCESITRRPCRFSTGDLAAQEIERYGQTQEYCDWICRNPQIKHQGVWRRICGNLATPWLEMVDLNVFLYLYPIKKEPKIKVADNYSHHYHCASIFDKRCLRLTTAQEKCRIIEEIELITPRFQCYGFRTAPEIKQRAERELTHYRIVNKTIEIDGTEEEIDFGIIFYDQENLEGRCHVYFSPILMLRGRVHPILPDRARFLASQPAIPEVPVQKNFYSALIFSVNQRAKRGPAVVSLYQGVEFTRNNPQRITLRNRVIVSRESIGTEFRNNVRSIKIERRPDIPIIAVLFSEEDFAGFCDFFIESDGDLSNNKIGREIIVDPGLHPPIRLPWLFFAPTAESIIIIAGEQS